MSTPSPRLPVSASLNLCYCGDAKHAPDPVCGQCWFTADPQIRQQYTFGSWKRRAAAKFALESHAKKRAPERPPSPGFMLGRYDGASERDHE